MLVKVYLTVMTDLREYIEQIVAESLDELKLRPTKTVDIDEFQDEFESEEDLERYLTKKTGTRKNTLKKKLMRKALEKKIKKKKKPDSNVVSKRNSTES